MKTETTKELKEELAKANEMLGILGKINRQLLEFIEEKLNVKRRN